MKMISNDLRSSCRAMLIGAYQEGGSTTRNSIFHDILDNSDVVATIPIYGDYKLTLNFWESDRQDIYNAGLSSDRCIAMQSGNEGYCQNYYYTDRRCIYEVFIAWKGDSPLYADIIDANYLAQEYRTTEVKNSNDESYPYSWYAYPYLKEKYIKGSVLVTSEVDHFEFDFRPQSGNAKYFNDYIYPCDGSGNRISFSFDFKTEYNLYQVEYPQIEWTNPNTGITSTISDMTQIPKIKLKTEREKSYTHGFSSIQLFLHQYRGIFSDFNTNEQLIAAHGEIVRAICLANGTDYRAAPLLLPESEE